MAQRSDAGVAWLRSERSLLLHGGARPSDLEEAVSLLIAGLDLLDVLPDELRARFPASTWPIVTKQRPKTDAAQNYALQSGWLLDVQRNLLERVVVDWTDELRASFGTSDGQKSTLLQGLLQAAFRPRSEARHKQDKSAAKRTAIIAVVDEQEDVSGKAESSASADRSSAILGQVVSSGLLAASQVLTQTARSHSSPASKAASSQLVTDATFAALECIVQEHEARQDEPGSLQHLLDASMIFDNLAQRDKFWQDAINALCAVPTRVANVLKGDKGPSILQDPIFFAPIAAQLEAVVYSLKDDAQTPARLTLVARLVEKITRSGTLTRAMEEAASATSASEDFLFALLGRVVERITDDDAVSRTQYINNWHRVIRALERQEAPVQFLQSIIAYTDQVCLIGRKAHDLVSEAERARAGAEGRAFLSQDNAKASLLIIRLLAIFLPAPLARSLHAPADSDARFVEIKAEDLDADENAAEDLSRWREVVLGQGQQLHGSRSAFSPAMARCIATLALPSHASPEMQERYCVVAIETVMVHWASSERIKRASLAEDTYLTTLILGLLAQCNAGSSTPAEMLKSAAFINGVSAHLSHQDPAFRRLGMLVAELLDASVKQASAQSQSSSTRKLEFGTSIWSGKGEGKEACRVLRAMFLSWDTSSPIRQHLPQDVKMLRKLAGLAPRVQPKTGSTIEATAELEVIGSMIAPVRRSPITRSLPERRPPQETSVMKHDLVTLVEDTSSLTLLSGGKARQARPLISEFHDTRPSTSGTQKLQAYSLPNESDGEESSSSESDSDDDEFGAKTVPATEKEDEPELLDVNVPKRRQRRRPVYIGELIPLLRSTERHENRKGLKNCEELIRRKTGWGSELEESAVELALALAALHNNWSTKHFEERRTGALSALLAACPQAAGGCIIEQYFSGHYSIAQRLSMLNALVDAARELAEGSGQQTALVAKQPVGSNANLLVKQAAAGAKKFGEEQYPEVRQVNKLNVLRTPQGPLIQETGGAKSRETAVNGRPVNVGRLAGAPITKLARYIDIAASVFIFPLMNRFMALLQDAGSRHSRSVTGRRSTQRQTAVWQGAGIGSVLSAPAVGSLLDTLAVLASLARNSLQFQRIIVPELLELSIATPKAMLPLLGHSGGGQSSGGDDDTDDMGRIHEGAMTLAVILVDAAREADRGRYLKTEKAMLLRELDMYAGEVFQLEHEKDRGSTSSLGRAGRASATLLLRIQEIQSQ